LARVQDSLCNFNLPYFVLSQGKNDLDKLYDQTDLNEDDEDNNNNEPKNSNILSKVNSVESSSSDQKNKFVELSQQSFQSSLLINKNNAAVASASNTPDQRKHLIENNSSFYKSLKTSDNDNNKLRTSLLVNRPISVHKTNEKNAIKFVSEDLNIVNKQKSLDFDQGSILSIEADEISDEKLLGSDEKDDSDAYQNIEPEKNDNEDDSEDGNKLVRSVKQMASILVKSAIDLALNDIKIKSNSSIDNEINPKSSKEIEKMYRYCFSAQKRAEQTNSRLGYYKDYNTKFESFDVDENALNDLNNQNYSDQENKFMVQFEDEPYE
jgi:hypothetical protein